MGTNFEMGTQRYLGALRDGAAVESAIGEANVAIHRDTVFAAAVEMLESSGVIDMKHLAGKAGISRASLYRYYADKLAVEAEVAGCLATRMATAAGGHERVLDKLRAVIDVMIEFPAGAAALGPVVAEAEPEVIAESCTAIVGHPGATPVLVGFAAMISSAHRRGDMAQVKTMADDILNQFELSLA